jgi:DsbC/DsbD-like thiol-disulfide interchange protein
VVALMAALGGNTPAQEATPLSPAQVVKTHAYASLDAVPRGKDFQVAVVVDINQAYHMNSHKPLDSYLIPTTLTPQLPAGFTLVDTIYPAGHQKKFPFSPDKPLDVYSGSVTLRLKLTAQSSAPLGAVTIPMTLRYQACNNSACLPPVKVPVSVELKVAAAGTATHPAHPEVFSAAGSSGN